MILPALLRSSRQPPGSARRARPLPVTWAVVALAWALLWAQALGMAHRIEHAGGTAPPHGPVPHGLASATQDDAAAPEALHSCVLFDGLCLADTLPGAPPPGKVDRAAHASPVAPVLVSWQALFAGHVLPRGPPAA